MQHSHWLWRLLFAVMAISGLYLASWYFARGGIQYFSPSSLQGHFQSEILLPLTEIPIYRSRVQPYDYKLVQYLVDKGYWVPSNSNLPPLVTGRWNKQWRDGQSDFHREFAWMDEGWIEWSDEQPKIAAALWPRVLQLLRSGLPSSDSYACHLMFLAKRTTNVDQFNRAIAADTELARALGMIK